MAMEGWPEFKVKEWLTDVCKQGKEEILDEWEFKLWRELLWFHAAFVIPITNFFNTATLFTFDKNK